MARSPVLLVLLIPFLGRDAPSRADEPARFEFTRLVAHWDQYGDPDYVKFVREAQPEVKDYEPLSALSAGANAVTASGPAHTGRGRRPRRFAAVARRIRPWQVIAVKMIKDAEFHSLLLSFFRERCVHHLRGGVPRQDRWGCGRSWKTLRDA